MFFVSMLARCSDQVAQRHGVSHLVYLCDVQPSGSGMATLSTSDNLVELLAESSLRYRLNVVNGHRFTYVGLPHLKASGTSFLDLEAASREEAECELVLRLCRASAHEGVPKRS